MKKQIAITEETDLILKAAYNLHQQSGNKSFLAYHILLYMFEIENDVVNQIMTRNQREKGREQLTICPYFTKASPSQLFEIVQDFNNKALSDIHLPIRPVHIILAFATNLHQNNHFTDRDIKGITKKGMALLDLPHSNKITVLAPPKSSDRGQIQPPSKRTKTDIPYIEEVIQGTDSIAHVSIGRESESNTILNTLSRSDNRSVLIVGENGTGKTNLVNDVCYKILQEKCPNNIKGTKIFKVNAPLFLSNCAFKGQLDTKFEKTIDFIYSSLPNKTLIIFDDIGSILSSFNEFTHTLRSYIDEKILQIVATCNTEDYKKYINKNVQFEKRVNILKISEPNEVDTKNILINRKSEIESHLNIIIQEDAIDEIIKISNRTQDKKEPCKSIDILEDVSSFLHNSSQKNGYEKQCIEDRLNTLTKIATKLNNNHCKKFLSNQNEIIRKQDNLNFNKGFVLDTDSLKSIYYQLYHDDINEIYNRDIDSIENEIRNNIFGQDDAIKAIIYTLKRVKIGMQSKNKPLSNFLFMGPTGVGKTETAKVLSSILKKNLIQLDLSEYSDKSAISKLIGASAGYVGYDDGGHLTERVLKNPNSIILLDEIDKAHESIFLPLLQILDEGRVTDGKGRTVDFRNTIIIITSNYPTSKIIKRVTDVFDKRLILEEQLNGTIRPEVINRIDNIIPFIDLSDEDMKKIATKIIIDIPTRLNKEFNIEYDNKIITHILDISKAHKMGTRPIKRLIDNAITDKIIDLFLRNGVSDINISSANGKICVNKKD